MPHGSNVRVDASDCLDFFVLQAGAEALIFCYWLS